MIIEPKHYEYLYLQRGDIAHEKNLERWKSAYTAALRATKDSLAGGLGRLKSEVSGDDCKNCKDSKELKVLDVGGGLGGIHTLIHQAFPLGYQLYILDGLTDPPIHRNSWQTFNNAEIGIDFLRKNGLKSIAYTDEVPHLEGGKFDLVVSFAAYGFHIHPGNYLSDLKKVVNDKTVLIFDVRRSKKEWLREFVTAFGTPKVLYTNEKLVRLAFHA